MLVVPLVPTASQQAMWLAACAGPPEPHLRSGQHGLLLQNQLRSALVQFRS
jgi:hypothetical protein